MNALAKAPPKVDTEHRCPTCGGPLSPLDFRIDRTSNVLIVDGRAFRLSDQVAALAHELTEARGAWVPYKNLVPRLWERTPADPKGQLRSVAKRLRMALEGTTVMLETQRQVAFRIARRNLA